MRSYYPLLCTVAQTAQVLDGYHRPGNVHDSNGAIDFIQECLENAKRGCKGQRVLETRHDSAFFSDKTVDFLNENKIEFTISVPFERFTELKTMIEIQKKWKHIDKTLSFFETAWAPDCWDDDYRFIFVKKKVKIKNKEPIQLELFTPYEQGYEFKVIVTNKEISAKKIIQYHNGRGAQENVFGELKSQCQMDYVPVRRLAGNQMYFFSAVLSHNLFRELQMQTSEKTRGTTEKRSTLWFFKEAKTIRRDFIQRAGRLTRPQGSLQLTLSGNMRTKKDFLRYLTALKLAS
jgi:hypothetical protein